MFLSFSFLHLIQSFPIKQLDPPEIWFWFSGWILVHNPSVNVMVEFGFTSNRHIEVVLHRKKMKCRL